MKCVLFTKMDRGFSLKKKTLKKYWKSQGIFSTQVIISSACLNCSLKLNELVFALYHILKSLADFSGVFRKIILNMWSCSKSLSPQEAHIGRSRKNA